MGYKKKIQNIIFNDITTILHYKADSRSSIQLSASWEKKGFVAKAYDDDESLKKTFREWIIKNRTEATNTSNKNI